MARCFHRPRGAPRILLLSIALLLPALAGCATDDLDEASTEATEQAEYTALVVQLETARLVTWQELNVTLRAYFAGDASRAQALEALREGQQMYESGLRQLNETNVPPAFEVPHAHLVASYRLGLDSLEAAEACIASTNFIACAQAPELGRASVEEHRQFVESFPLLPEELAREFPLPIG